VKRRNKKKREKDEARTEVYANVSGEATNEDTAYNKRIKDTVCYFDG
jgi:hypothetical protein